MVEVNKLKFGEIVSINNFCTKFQLSISKHSFTKIITKSPK